jgi:iron(III) transport system substrate-binding protein
MAVQVGVVAGVVLVLVGTYHWFLRGAAHPLVVYCAHDSVYSDAILKEFERRTGVQVSPRYDTEATKSLGLVELLMQERDHPRCDVFWNNELLGTLDLAAEGLLAPYAGPGYKRIPADYRDPEGYWAGFAARLRVFIVNTDRVRPVTEEELARRLAGDLSRVAMAVPLYGTTLTHYCALWEQIGEVELKQWHADMRARGLREAPGNATVKNLVAQGACDFGFTDTDDFFLAKDAGYPVEMVPARLPNGRTICIPNTVAIIKGSSRQKEARMLVDFLLSEECEILLAQSASRQIPVGDVDLERLPEEVRGLRVDAREAQPLGSLLGIREDCLRWLKSLP